MPDPDLICEVRTEGGTYRDWMAVTVAQSFDQGWMRTFSLVCAEPSTVRNLRLKPGDRVDIALAGQVVIERGYIRTRQAAYDANRHAVRIDGYSRAGLAVETSVDGGTGQYRGYPVDAIARDVLKPYGIEFKLENPPEGAKEPFPQVMVRRGESPFTLIARLCNQQGVWLRADPDGTFVAGVRRGGSSVVFEEGRNILAASAQIEYRPVVVSQFKI